MKKRVLFYLFGVSSTLLNAQDTASCQFMKQRMTAHEKLASHPSVLASNLRSDTVDILKYTISLNITDFTTDTLRGNTSIRFAPKLNGIKTLSLDLLHMKIDSLHIGAASIASTYNDTLIICKLPVTLNTTDTAVITVYYHGKPKIDASGWGGFYFQPPFAYNLGVGFAANPHNYGRVWYPCFDNFVERAVYEFNISTNAGKIAYCNGLLAHDTTDGSGLRTRKWVLNKTIPSYLACVAVAPFTQVNMTFASLTGPKPVVIAAIPGDTVNMKNSFIHLPNAFAGFESRYGPYRWDKVGYSLVPFSSGAMEHASNITFPKAFANGTTTYESQLMAHELSHHWFGDLVTCNTEGDMWLNEGWATYSQYIFMENVYGYPAYLAQVVGYHDDVLHYANWKEGGYLAVSGVPHAYTYGDHVYHKGGDVAHTLRSYMGDSLFFLGLKYHLSNRPFQSSSSTDFMNDLIAGTGLGNIQDFFNGWVFNPGWPHFSVDSFSVLPNGSNFDITIYVRQRLTGAPAFFKQVPLALSLNDSLLHSSIQHIIVNGQYSTFHFTVPFRPSYAGLNLDDKISHAVTADRHYISSTSPYFNSQLRGRMLVTATNASISTDSAWICVEHNYTTPDPFKTGGRPYLLSPNRYWKVDGLFPATFNATGQITYDGRAITSGGGGSLDNNLLTTTNLEDSVVLLYRPNTAADWMLDTGIIKNEGSLTDKYGIITIRHLHKGEYVLALKGFYTGITENTVPPQPAIHIWPNPASDRFSVELKDILVPNGGIDIRVHDMQGRLVHTEKVLSSGFSLNASGWTNGVYFLSVYSNGRPAGHTRLVVLR
ncbi:MAG: M1 family aminopeptidase [Bacteroidia bacterium]